MTLLKEPILTNCSAYLLKQAKDRKDFVVTGNKEQAVSELEAGRRTIVRDEDDPEMEANVLDGLMVSKVDDLEEDIRAAYMPVRGSA